MKNELVLQTTRKVGFLKWEVCILSFFKDELLITSLNNKKQQELFLVKKNNIKKEGGGVIKQTFSMSSVIPEYTEMIKQMSKEDILKENTENMGKKSISNIKFKKATKHTDYETDSTSLKQGKLILSINNKKIKFKHLYVDKDKSVRDYIKNYL